MPALAAGVPQAGRPAIAGHMQQGGVGRHSTKQAHADQGREGEGKGGDESGRQGGRPNELSREGEVGFESLFAL